MIRQEIIRSFVTDKALVNRDNIEDLFSIANNITGSYQVFLSNTQLFVRLVSQMPGGNYNNIIKLFNIESDNFIAVHRISGSMNVNDPILCDSIVSCGEKILETLFFPKTGDNEYYNEANESFEEIMMEKAVRNQYNQLFLINMVISDLAPMIAYSNCIFTVILLLCKRIACSYLDIVYAVDKLVVPELQEKIFSICMPLHFRIFKRCRNWYGFFEDTTGQLDLAKN